MKKLYTTFLIPIRIIVFIIGYAGYLIDIVSDWAYRMASDTEYIRKGGCRHCGRCCYNLAIEIPHSWFRFPIIIKLLNFWHYVAYNFKPIGVFNDWLVYECQYLIPKKLCGIYSFRHRICRTFPRLQFFGRPRVHRNCGFYFARKDGTPIFEEILRDKMGILKRN